MKKLMLAVVWWMWMCALGVAATPQQLGGIYYAYDVTADSMPPAPAGFKPVYVSHYGRHGSRWPVNKKIYSNVSDFFQNQQMAQNLTPEGKEMWKLTTLCAGNANGHLGELTPLGERQHRDIARRMAARFPTLFSGDARVVARSSVEPRCIMSMAAFCEALKEANPKISLRRHASPGDMAFIHPKTETADLMKSDDAPWRWEFDPYRDSISQCRALAARLFKDPAIPGVEESRKALFMRSLYDIGISVQDIDGLDADILSYFAPEDLEKIWEAANYIQYVGNGRSPLSGASGTECVRPLLIEIMTRADEMLASGEVQADLRFGHDTDLLRLVSLLDINGYGMESEDMKEVAAKWRNYDIAPMGANLQLVFYRNGEGEVLVAPRLNERPARIGSLPEAAPGFYSWDAVRALFVKVGGE